MCTISFIPRAEGYALAMNRDEQKNRPIALPPRATHPGEIDVIAPAEPSGGTWIALNAYGVTFALLNWYAVNPVRNARRSRGDIVNAVALCKSKSEVRQRLEQLDLSLVAPYRLFAIFKETNEILESRWNMNVLEFADHPWTIQLWSSSGWNESAAHLMRSLTFRKYASRLDTKDSVKWLKEVHTSHDPVAGPGSICMHREDAETLSLSVIDVENGRARFNYLPGPPCLHGSWHESVLPLRADTR